MKTFIKILLLNLFFCAQAFCQTDYGNGIIIQRIRGAMRSLLEEFRQSPQKNIQGVDISKLKQLMGDRGFDVNLTDQPMFDAERNPRDTRIDTGPAITLYKPAWQLYMAPKFRSLLPVLVHQRFLSLLDGRDTSSRTNAEFCRQWFGDNPAAPLIADLYYSHQVLADLYSGLAMDADRDYLNFQSGKFSGFTIQMLDALSPRTFDRKWTDSMTRSTRDLGLMVRVGDGKKIDVITTSRHVQEMINQLHEKIFELAPSSDEVKP